MSEKPLTIFFFFFLHGFLCVCLFVWKLCDIQRMKVGHKAAAFYLGNHSDISFVSSEIAKNMALESNDKDECIEMYACDNSNMMFDKTYKSIELINDLTIYKKQCLNNYSFYISSEEITELVSFGNGLKYKQKMSVHNLHISIDKTKINENSDLTVYWIQLLFLFETYKNATYEIFYKYDTYNNDIHTAFDIALSTHWIGNFNAQLDYQFQTLMDNIDLSDGNVRFAEQNGKKKQTQNKEHKTSEKNESLLNVYFTMNVLSLKDDDIVKAWAAIIESDFNDTMADILGAMWDDRSCFVTYFFLLFFFEIFCELVFFGFCVLSFVFLTLFVWECVTQNKNKNKIK